MRGRKSCREYNEDKVENSAAAEHETPVDLDGVARFGDARQVPEKLSASEEKEEILEVSSFEGHDDIDEDEDKNDGMQPWQSSAARNYATSPAPSEAGEDTEQPKDAPKKNADVENVADDTGFVADSEEDEDQDAENSGEDSSWSEDDDEGRRETQKARPHSSRRKRGGDIAAHGILLQRFDENIIEEISNDDVSTASLPPWAYLIVGNIANKRTWHLPVRDAQGRISRKLLTKARQILQRGITTSKSTSIKTTREVRMRVRRLSRHVWPGLPTLEVHSSMKLDKAEDTIDEKLKSELHYLQNAYKRANPDHEDDEGARRVEHTLLREETQALLKELQPSPKEEPSDGEGDEEMDEDTEEVVQMKQAAALVEKMRSRRKQMMRSITAPAQLPSEKALDKPSRSLEAPKMPRLTSDSVLTKPSRGGMLRIVADPVCIGNSKAALRAKKLERHRVSQRGTRSGMPRFGKRP